ncbi:MAG: SRPBCC domain-containing protein [Acidimicrobiales bacterium]
MTENSWGTIEGALHSFDGFGVVRMEIRYEAVDRNVWSAMTEPERLAGWFGNVSGDLHVGGVFTVVVHTSGFDGQGRVDVCVPQRHLVVTMWEEEGAEHSVALELVADGNHTTLELEVRGIPIDVVWAYGAGWQEHLEDLGSHLEGRNRADMPRSEAHFDELTSIYREMPVVPL